MNGAVALVDPYLRRDRRLLLLQSIQRNRIYNHSTILKKIKLLIICVMFLRVAADK
jgi:hypothetical protein